MALKVHCTYPIFIRDCGKNGISDSNTKDGKHHEKLSLSLSLNHTVLAIAVDVRVSFYQQLMPKMQRNAQQFALVIRNIGKAPFTTSIINCFYFMASS